MTRKIGIIALGGFIGSVLLSNWLVAHFGVVPIGFGLTAPAAVYAVGVAFTLRDLAHRAFGPAAVIAAIIVGAALSWLVAPQFAVASGAAFLLSELADLAVYTPLERRGWITAVAASNAVGLVVDSILFLTLAFGSLEFLPGQIVGKAWMTVLAVLILIPIRRASVLARHA